MLTFRRAFTLVEIMIVLLIIGILVAIAVPGVITSKMSANDAYAKQALRSVSAACEWYSANKNVYPDSEATLLAASPPYLNSGYCGRTVSGFVYNCTFGPTSYTVTAAPVNTGTTGTTTMTISTGGVLTP